MGANSFSLKNQYSQYIHVSRYARWVPELKRRETWDETVTRVVSYLEGKFPDTDIDFQEIHKSILNLEVMPSMRLMMTAGPAADKSNIALFNCSFISIDHPRAFDEALFILMNGTGLGFSVERQEIGKLPEVPDELHETDTTIIVGDSKLGWAKAYKQLISLLYSGEIPKWDLSRLRPAGSRLKTFGGRASGPDPLNQLFNFTVQKFSGAKGRKLNSLECHDIMCKIGEVVVVGGVRRSALISLSNLSDQRMRDAKSGEWWHHNPQRALANNSACYTERPEVGQFMEEWISLYNSKSGERGMFNRLAAYEKMKETERSTKDKNGNPLIVGVNPCGEILLRSSELCNLSEVVCRPEDTKKDLERKVKVATILGTLQSAMTDFPYVRPIWKKNCDEERLLGVSMTGVMDCPLVNSVDDKTKKILSELRSYARDVNSEYAEKIGINPSVSITCNKPSGTVSQLVDSGSGLHKRHAKYYIRRVRNDIKDPLSKFMIDEGFPYEEDVMNPQNVVFEFPIRSPEGSITRDDTRAVDELEIWKMFRTHWCDHNPSVTITVREDEWPEVGAWVWNNFDEIGGLSFLPHSDHSYRQAPYEEVSLDVLEELEARMPENVDFSELVEIDDETTSSQEFACVSGACEI